MDTVAIVIPVLTGNKYHEKGDLAPFGDTTLLEWKVSQLRKMASKIKIYITSPDDDLPEKVNCDGVEFILRPQNIDFSETVSHVIGEISESTILWTNVTSPFLGEKDYDFLLAEYMALDRQRFDSLVAVFELNDYAVCENKPVNFSTSNTPPRSQVPPVSLVTNGCYLFEREKSVDGIFGLSPFYRPLSKLAATEIKDMDDLVIANHMIARYILESSF